MKLPWFAFYPDDFLGGTVHFSASEVGTYIRLLIHQWGHGHLPDGADRLARIAGEAPTDDVLAKFPIGPDGKRRNERMENERAKKSRLSEMQAEKGRKSAEKRWGHPVTEPQPDGNHGYNTGYDSVIVGLQPKSNPPQPQPQPQPPIGGKPPITPGGEELGLSAGDEKPHPPKRSGSRKPVEYPPEFEAVWYGYPRKDGKVDAARAWARLSPADRKAVEEDLPKRVRGPWAGKEARYVPHFATFLNNQRWLDPLNSGPLVPEVYNALLC